MPPRKHCVSVVDATATAKAFGSASASGTSHLILTLQQQPEEEEEEEEGEGLVLIVVDLVLNRGNEIGLGGAGGAMKGGFAGGSYSGKRRWKGLVIGVLGLVFPSMLVPLLFLLGLHNGFHPPGYVPEQRNSPSGGGSKHVDDFVKNFTPTLSKVYFPLFCKKPEPFHAQEFHRATLFRA
ncbi:uncharacterized protein [Pyrus communis]|uniref:uncharacterized protein n=1 Tax=Pyrus communis TaxID=23211 RepID=UPI0035C00361